MNALQNLIVFERRLNKELTEDERVHSGVFTGVSSEIQNDLIECIDSVIQHQIYKEIENCRFLSIQVDETTDVSTKEQLSAIIRLDSEGETVERIMKLFILVLIDPTFPWLLVYEIHLQNRIVIIANYYHILLLNIY